MFPDASEKVLTQHLREMEKDGLVIRKDLSGGLRHVVYFLSDSMGFAVLHLIGTLTKWGREYLPYGGQRPGIRPRTPPCGLRTQIRAYPRTIAALRRSRIVPACQNLYGKTHGRDHLPRNTLYIATGSGYRPRESPIGTVRQSNSHAR
jgi:hypothetical protein